jgi:integrase
MSVKLVLIKNNSKDNFGIVQVRIIENSEVRRRSLKIKVTEAEWEKYFDQEKQRFKKLKGFPEADIYNQTITEYLKGLQSVGNDLELIPDDKKLFLKYWKQLIKTTENHGTAIKHQVVINKLLKYLGTHGKTDIPFKEITAFLLRDLRLYLKTSKDPKSLSNNSINHYLKVIKSIINHAQKDGYYNYIINPFASMTFTKEKILKRVLNEDDLERLINRKIEDQKIDMARKMFLFQLFGNGMRASDIILLRWNNIDNRRIKYRMFKTDEPMNVPINLNMNMILTDILGKEARYKDMIEKMTHDITEDDKVVGLTLKDLDERLKEIAVRKEILDQSLIIKLRDSSKYLELNGYYLAIESERIFRQLLTAKEELLNYIDLTFGQGMMGAISNQKRNPIDFIFPILKNEEFKNIDAKNDFSKITIQQYKTIKHAIIVYDRKLKLVSEGCKIDLPLSSHIARHSYTNLLLNMDNVNLYDISQSLGHKNITATENYIQSGFSSKKIDYLNKSLDRKHRPLLG